MTAEDRLREILRAEADTITPTGEGLARIQLRVARRRRLRLWLLPSTALATAGALLAFFAFAPDERSNQTLLPGQTPSATTSASAPPTASPAPIPADSYSGYAVWPFRSQADAEAWDSDAMPWAESSLEVGRHFLRDYLRITDVTLRQDCVSCEVLAVVAEGRNIATLTLGHYSARGTRLYTVISVLSDDLEVTTPKQGATVSSALAVSGTVTGADENVRVTLLDEDGDPVAQGFAAAGSEAPWRTTLSWSDGTWRHGALVARTGNLRDGATNRLTVLAVTQGAAPVDPTFSAIVDGHVSLYDGTSGALVRQLTFPPAGKVDTEAAWARDAVLWVRMTSAGACGGELDLRTPEETKTLGSTTAFRYRHPQLAGLGQLLGWVEEPCDTSPSTLVIAPRPRAGVAEPARRIEGPTGSVVRLLDLRDDGAALVLTNDREASGPGSIGLLAPGAEKLEGLTPISPEPGCNLTNAAFDGDQVVGFQSCEDGIQLVRWAFDGSVAGKDKALAEEDPSAISVRDGRVLVWRFGGDSVGVIATYADGRFHDLTSPDRKHCTSIGDQKGCIKSPDW